MFFVFLALNFLIRNFVIMNFIPGPCTVCYSARDSTYVRFVTFVLVNSVCVHICTQVFADTVIASHASENPELALPVCMVRAIFLSCSSVCIFQCCGSVSVFGLPDPDPSLFVRIRILPSTGEKSKKNLDFY